VREALGAREARTRGRQRTVDHDEAGFSARRSRLSRKLEQAHDEVRRERERSAEHKRQAEEVREACKQDSARAAALEHDLVSANEDRGRIMAGLAVA
jgi:chromosome segregation ATPase